MSRAALLRRRALFTVAAASLFATSAYAAPPIGLPIPSNLPHRPPITLDCSNPPAAACSNPKVMNTEWPAGSCGDQQRQACATRLLASWTATATKDGTSKMEFLPDTETAPRAPVSANLLPGRWAAYDAGGMSVTSSADPTFHVDPLSVQISRAGLPKLAALASAFRPGAPYQGDGTAVSTCREYAYKRFWDYAEFQSEIASCNRDPRCIYDVAYGTSHPIANRVLEERNGSTPLDHQIELVSGVFPKNVFLQAGASMLWPYTTTFAGIPADPVKAAKVDQIKALLASMPQYKIGTAPLTTGSGGSSLPVLPIGVSTLPDFGSLVTPIATFDPNATDLQLAVPPNQLPPGQVNLPPGQNVEAFPNEWAWHKAMHDRTTTVTDAEIQEFERRKVDFAGALEDWMRVIAAESLGKLPSASTYARARKRITDALLTELDLGPNGCLDATKYGCDWAPGEFERRFAHLYGPEMNDAFVDCAELAGATRTSFDTNVPKGAPRSDVPAFKAWLDTRKAELKAQFVALPTYPGTAPGSGVIGASTSSSNFFGDPKTFGAGYDYDIGWFVKKKAQRSTSDTRACAFTGRLQAMVHADAKLLGQNVASLLGADHVVKSESWVDMDPDANGGAPHVHSETSIMGEDIYDKEDAVAPSAWEVTASPGTIESPHAQLTFVVVVVPVTFEAWAELRFGANASASGRATNTCAIAGKDPQFGINVALGPYAYVDAVGTIAVGVPGFEVGVKGNIGLVHVDVPISGGVNMAERASDHAPVLRFDTKGQLKLRELDGSMSLFAEALLLTYEKEIFSWNGFHQDIDMWKAQSDVDLSAYQIVPPAP